MSSNVTVFKDLYSLNSPKYVDIDYVLQRIKEEVCSELVESIREEKDKSSRNILKKKLPCVLFSGEFSSRADNALVQHSGFICLDFDGFENEEVLTFSKDYLIKDKYTYSVFTSPSGDGLKVIVKIPDDSENHRSYFNGLKEYYNSPYFDESCVNESRICYMSSDKYIHIDRDSDVFSIKAKPKEYVQKQSVSHISIQDDDRVIKGLLKWWEERYGMVEGERNRNVFILSMALNEFGISEMEAKSVCMQFAHQGFDEEEIKACVESAYRKSHLFNTKSFTDDERFDNYSPSSVETYEKTKVNFHNIYESAFVDVKKKIEFPPVAISMGTYNYNGKQFPIPFGTYGNFSCIVGASKSKKTFLKSLIMASYIGGNSNQYGGIIKNHRERDMFVIDIDTEQSAFDAQRVFKRTMKMVGCEDYEFYKPFALRPYDPKQRLEFIEWLIYESDMRENIGLVGIDGLADLVDDFNDLKESQKAIQKVMTWTADKNLHLTTILHSNYGSAKAVGHIGSSMLKKAETVCSVVNTDGIVTATFTHTRGFPIESFSYDVQKETGLPFIIDDNSLTHRESEIYKAEFEKREEVKPIPFINPSDAFDNPLDTIPF
jgi:hypothetical protein